MSLNARNLLKGQPISTALPAGQLQPHCNREAVKKWQIRETALRCRRAVDVIGCLKHLGRRHRCDLLARPRPAARRLVGTPSHGGPQLPRHPRGCRCATRCQCWRWTSTPRRQTGPLRINRMWPQLSYRVALAPVGLSSRNGRAASPADTLGRTPFHFSIARS